MSFNRLIIIFGIILAVFTGIIFFQFSPKSNNTSQSKSTDSTITINKHKFNLELAKTSEQQIAGLSGRSSLPQDQGMLFIFDTPGYYSFWMKKMKFPIDIIFIKDDLIVSIEKNAKPPVSTDTNPPLYKPEEPANKVIEINAGLSDKYNIKKGDTVEIKTK